MRTFAATKKTRATSYNQFIPFKRFVESDEREKLKEKFTFTTFSNTEDPPLGKTHHVVFLPTGVSMNTMFDKLFGINCCD